ncbi:MAG: TonB-dependent receptor plug domain-containing protein [Verrucomicrobiota bacterium]
MKPVLPPLPFTCAVLLFSGLASAFAQSAAPAVPAAPEKVVELSPFVVNSDGDTGYTASESLMGGRINTPLKFTPASVSVITRQFLDDIAATTPADVAEWAVNVAPNYVQNTSSFSTYTYNIRNLGASSATRNYVLWYGQSDDFNTERYEFARGPNGTVYGDSNVGGVPTTWTKRATFGRNRSVLKATVDSYGSLRGSVDFNRALSDRLALRVNAVHSESAHWLDVPDKRFDGVALAATVKLTPRDELRIDGEFGYYVYPFYSTTNSDFASYWDGTTVYNGVTAPSTAAATGVVANPASFVYIPGAANGGLNQMGSYFRTNGTGRTLYPTARPEIPNFPVLPSREFVLNPSDSLSRLHQYFYSFAWAHRFSDNLSTELAYARHDASRLSGPTVSGQRYMEYRIDVNTVLPGGAANPNFGKAYQDREVNEHTPSNNVTQLHALVNSRFAPSWVTQNFIGLVGTRLDRFDNIQTRLTRTNPPAGTNQLLNNAANIVLVRRYWDQAGQPVTGSPVPDIPGVTLEYVPQTEQHQRKAVDFAQIASVSRFFSNRLALMLGYRIDHVIDSQHQTANIPVDARGLPQLGAVILTPESPIVPRPVVGAKIYTDRKAASKNAGTVAWVLPWLGLVANYAESIASNTAGAAKLDGTIPGITRNEGMDFGFKLSLFDGRFAGTVSYYKNKQLGNLLGAANNTEINNLWDDIGRFDVPEVDYRDTQDKEGRGWELEFTGNPLRQLRLTWNLALPESTIINLRPGLRAYYEQNRAEWQAGANDPNNPQRARIQTSLNTIATTLNGLTPGTPVNDTYKYQSNIYATYSFGEGWLKSFEVGGGVNFRGKNKIDVAFDNPYRFLYSPAYYLVSAHISYRYKFSRTLTGRFQLNVRNLLDEDDYVFLSQDGNGYGTYREKGIATNPLVQVTDRYRQQDPRQFIFSTTFEF